MEPTLELKKAFFKANLAFMLADAANSLMMSFEADSKKIGKMLSGEMKMKSSNMIKAAMHMKVTTADFARIAYGLKMAEEFCEDSDYIMEVMMILSDRTGGDKNARIKARSMLYNMPSVLKLLDK